MIAENYNLLFVAFFLVWLTGTLARQAIVRQDTAFLGVGQWAVDFGLGAGIISFWLLLSCQLFGKIYFPSIFYIILILLCLVFYRSSKSFKNLWQAARRLFNLARTINIAGLVLFVFLCLMIYIVWMKAYFGPLEWDAWYLYGYHAKAFYIDKIIKPEFMVDPSPYILSAVDYRIILPMTEAWIFYIIGGAWDNSFGFLTVMYYLALLSFLYSIIKESHSSLLGVLVVLLIGSMTPAIYLGSTGMADLVLAFYILGGCFFLHRWLLTKNVSFVILSALFFVCGTMTKNEGINISIMTAIIFGFYAGLNRDRKKNIRPAMIFLILLVMGYIPYMIAYFTSVPVHHLYSAYLARKSETLGIRTGMIFTALLHQWTDYNSWGFLWIFLLVGLVSSLVGFVKKENLESGVIWLIILAQGAVYFLIHLTHPGDLSYFLSKTPDRLLFHLAPTLVYLSLVQWKVKKNPP